MQFKKLMSARELFDKNLSNKEKQQILVKYANWLATLLGRPLVQDDFKVKGRISYATIASYFDSSLTNFFNKCSFDASHRKKNMSDKELKQFLCSIRIIDTRGCWLTNYFRAKGTSGRQRVKFKRRLESLYRVAFILFKKPIPDTYFILHSCDNPLCYNPNHLKTGTAKDNVLDAVSKGRWQVSRPKNRKPHRIKDPYDKNLLLQFAKEHSKITEKNEWLFMDGLLKEVYPDIHIGGRKYLLHRLLLANKLNKLYDDIEIARHKLPDGSKPHKHDVNPDHLFEGSRRENSFDSLVYNKSYKLSFIKAKLVKEAAKKTDFSSRGSKMKFDKKWARKLDVHEFTISSIRRGESWNDCIK